MQDLRRRSDGPGPAQGRARSSLEALEGRLLLSGASGIRFYMPSDLPPRTVQHQTAPISVNHPLSASPHQLSILDNDGKVLSGRDRQGDEWTITVHGPGVAIVTDATPADGLFNDDLDIIQLVGTSPTETYVTGQAKASALQITDGVIFFDRLVALDGVASIVLNGFTLTDTVPDNTAGAEFNTPEIYLPRGVGLLQFHNIESVIDISTDAIDPIDIVIGETGLVLPFEPTIRLDSIFNTVFESGLTVQSTTPSTRPTVNILVNGQLHGLEFVSSTAQPITAAQQFAFQPVGTTGRTAVRAIGIDNLAVVGSARNFTASRRAIPFQDGFSGLDHLGNAQFGGNADAVGLDVAGPINNLTFARGLGNPAGLVPETQLGLPNANRGFPSYGLLGGLVTANRIGRVTIGQADTILANGSDPNNLQSLRQGVVRHYQRLGTAMTRSAITSADSIGQTTIIGNGYNSAVFAGYHYPSFVAGLDPVRAPSRIGPVAVRGDLVDTAIAASYRPAGDSNFNLPPDEVGAGRIKGHFQGNLYSLGGVSPLQTQGAGFFARTKTGGYLPPPSRPDRIQSVLILG